MENGAGLDVGGVGSIVWVRRRNGSWWPGKILGPDELTTSHLASPRTGTPVKLLGREDASVDWYNLEKSKRVKAFRCGEFDDCIGRAESSQGMPPKKREKYARREDAILHALELEKEILRKQGKLDRPPSHARSKSSGSAKKDSCGSDISNGRPGKTKSNRSRNQDTSIKGETVSSPVHSQKDQAGIQPSTENGHAEIMTRMKGLQDLGLKTTCAKQKFTSFGALGVDDTLSPFTRVSSMERPTHINGEQRLEGVLRAKRSRRMYLPPESFDVSDCKEIPRNQIQMSPSRFRGCDSYPFRRVLIEDDTSEFLEDDESGSSESTSSESESESDSSETEPDMDEDITSRSGATVCMDARPGAFRRLDSMGQGESDDSSLSGEMSHFYPHYPLSVNEAVSKWQLKGKRNRNVRNLEKISMDAAEIRGYDGSAHELYPEERGTFRKRLLGQSSRRSHDFYDDVDMAGLSAKDFGPQMFGFDGTGSLYMPRDSSKSRNSFNRNIRNWEGMPWESHAAAKREWENTMWHFDPKFSAHHSFGGKRRSMLLDVDLKVQSSYQKEPVPIVSLMSKWDGKAIIGHPIQIEAVGDNSTETFLSTNGYFSNGLMNHGHTSLPSTWRTAKRTNLRVPHPHRPVALGSHKIAEYHSLDHERKPPFKKHDVGSSNCIAGLDEKSISHVPGSPTDRQLQRKSPKEVRLYSSQKITFSSTGIEHTLSSKPTNDKGNSEMDGLIKPESSGPTTVACIPLKLVFSGLLERINRPPSNAASKVILDAVRDPS